MAYVEDERKTGILNGLRQLSIEQLERIKRFKGAMCYDKFNYKDGMFCPLAIGLGLDQIVKEPTQEKVYAIMALAGFSINNTWGKQGQFYTNSRDTDLRSAVEEVLTEKRAALATT